MLRNEVAYFLVCLEANKHTHHTHGRHAQNIEDTHIPETQTTSHSPILLHYHMPYIQFDPTLTLTANPLYPANSSPDKEKETTKRAQCTGTTYSAISDWLGSRLTLTVASHDRYSDKGVVVPELTASPGISDIGVLRPLREYETGTLAPPRMPKAATCALRTASCISTGPLGL